MRQFISLAVASALVIQVAFAQETQPFSVEDLVRMSRISDPRASPNGADIAFVIRETDMEANRGRTDLWLVGLENPRPRRLTTHEDNDSMPRWSADGDFLYFLSTRSESSQVWRMPITDGPPQQVTDLPLEVNAFALSPTDDRLVVSIDVYRDCEDLACSRNKLDELEASKSSAQHYDRLMVRHWDTWKDGRRAVLFSIPLKADGLAADRPVNLSGSLDADVPSKPFGGPKEFVFTPDGTEVIFTAKDSEAPEAWSTDFDIYRIAADGSGTPENLTADNPAYDGHPLVAPDGKTLAYLAMQRPGFEADRMRMVLLDLQSGRRRVLTEDWDRSVSEFVFSSNGRTIFATAQNVGEKPLWRINSANGQARLIVGGGYVAGLTVTKTRIVFGRDNLQSPVELFSARDNGHDLQQLTDINGEALARIRMGEYEQFSFAGWNDDTVYGYVVKPADFDPSKSYPVAFLIHGGPQGSFSDHFHYRWNPQTYAGAGFAVITIDFHGSTGYGQTFTDAISDDWGGKPLVDLQKGLEAALERYPWLDGDRVCALGASYGGYMINWIAGNWPDRFRCLVNHDGLFDQRMMYYATEELWFPEWEHRGPPFSSPTNYQKHNPVNHVENWQTPMLVVHGALDYRVPYTQGLATFTALQRQDIPSELLFFPDENHWILKPHNSIRWHETVNSWLDRWLTPSD